MPYMKVKSDGKVCVSKQGSDGKPVGEPLHCYTGNDADKKANAYMKALYANVKDSSQFSESLTDKIRAVSDSFYEMFNTQDPKPYCYVRDIGTDYIIVEEGDQLYKVTYSEKNGQITFQDKASWTPVKAETNYVSMSQKIADAFDSFLIKVGARKPKVNEKTGFLFADLASSEFQVTEPKFIDGMAAGTFTSMMGEEITFLPEELEDYVKNTQKVIDSTKTENGEIVGLPIDKSGHDHIGGAGWIVGLQLDKTRSIIRFLVNWTQEGYELIKSNAQRFFSPSVDTEGRYIRGGSLTNWPATRLSTGQILLRPVELSKQIMEIDMDKSFLDAIEGLKAGILDAIAKLSVAPKTQELQQPPTDKPSTSDISPVLRELLGTPEGIEELGKKATEIAQESIHAEKRKAHTVEFASRMVGGTPERPFGLPMKSADLVALLLSLPENKALAVENVLQQALHAAVDFSERGVDSMGFIRKPKLPAEFQAYMRQWIEAGKKPETFFEANPEAGKAENYDLSEWVKE